MRNELIFIAAVLGILIGALVNLGHAYDTSPKCPEPVCFCEHKARQCGDLNGDGAVTASDALAVLFYSVGNGDLAAARGYDCPAGKGHDHDHDSDSH